MWGSQGGTQATSWAAGQWEPRLLSPRASQRFLLRLSGAADFSPERDVSPQRPGEPGSVKQWPVHL